MEPALERPDRQAEPPSRRRAVEALDVAEDHRRPVSRRRRAISASMAASSSARSPGSGAGPGPTGSIPSRLTARLADRSAGGPQSTTRTATR